MLGRRFVHFQGSPAGGCEESCFRVILEYSSTEDQNPGNRSSVPDTVDTGTVCNVLYYSARYQVDFRLWIYSISPRSFFVEEFLLSRNITWQIECPAVSRCCEIAKENRSMYSVRCTAVRVSGVVP